MGCVGVWLRAGMCECVGTMEPRIAGYQHIIDHLHVCGAMYACVCGCCVHVCVVMGYGQMFGHRGVTHCRLPAHHRQPSGAGGVRVCVCVCVRVCVRVCVCVEGECMCKCAALEAALPLGVPGFVLMVLHSTAQILPQHTSTPQSMNMPEQPEHNPPHTTQSPTHHHHTPPPPPSHPSPQQLERFGASSHSSRTKQHPHPLTLTLTHTRAHAHTATLPLTAGGAGPQVAAHGPSGRSPPIRGSGVRPAVPSGR